MPPVAVLIYIFQFSILIYIYLYQVANNVSVESASLLGFHKG